MFFTTLPTFPIFIQPVTVLITNFSTLPTFSDPSPCSTRISQCSSSRSRCTWWISIAWVDSSTTSRSLTRQQLINSVGHSSWSARIELVDVFLIFGLSWPQSNRFQHRQTAREPPKERWTILQSLCRRPHLLSLARQERPLACFLLALASVTFLCAFRWTCHQARFRLVTAHTTVSEVAIDFLAVPLPFTRSPAIITFHSFPGSTSWSSAVSCPMVFLAGVLAHVSAVYLILCCVGPSQRRKHRFWLPTASAASQPSAMRLRSSCSREPRIASYRCCISFCWLPACCVSACNCSIKLSTSSSWITACFSSALTWEPMFATRSFKDLSETSRPLHEWSGHDGTMTLLAGCTLMQWGCLETVEVRVAVASQPWAFVDYELCSATLTVCFWFSQNAVWQSDCMWTMGSADMCTSLTVNSIIKKKTQTYETHINTRKHEKTHHNKRNNKHRDTKTKHKNKNKEQKKCEEKQQKTENKWLCDLFAFASVIQPSCMWTVRSADMCPSPKVNSTRRLGKVGVARIAADVCWHLSLATFVVILSMAPCMSKETWSQCGGRSTDLALRRARGRIHDFNVWKSWKTNFKTGTGPGLNGSGY